MLAVDPSRARAKSQNKTGRAVERVIRIENDEDGMARSLTRPTLPSRKTHRAKRKSHNCISMVFGGYLDIICGIQTHHGHLLEWWTGTRSARLDLSLWVASFGFLFSAAFLITHSAHAERLAARSQGPAFCIASRSCAFLLHLIVFCDLERALRISLNLSFWNPLLDERNDETSFISLLSSPSHYEHWLLALMKQVDSGCFQHRFPMPSLRLTKPQGHECIDIYNGSHRVRKNMYL